MIEIRKYKKKDFKEVNNILEEAFGFSKKGKRSYNLELVAVYDGIVVGYLCINPNYDSVRDISYYHLNYVCVHKDYRNKRVATKLLEKVFTIAKNNKVSYIELTSNKKRVEAQALYKYNGFVVRESDIFRKEL